ncbi:MAG: TlpA family protein disulfide reductase [Lachnospirales bacterium]
MKKRINVFIMLVTLTIPLTSCNAVTSAVNASTVRPTDAFIGKNVGEFSTFDVFGNEVNQDIFAENDLTMVNVFTTQYPGDEEMSELEELYNKISVQNVGVIGICLDTRYDSKKIDMDTLSLAKDIYTSTGVTFPYLIPDENNLNSRLSKINTFPETFFVDSEGNFVGGTYIGSDDFEGWSEVVNRELLALFN